MVTLGKGTVILMPSTQKSTTASKRGKEKWVGVGGQGSCVVKRRVGGSFSTSHETLWQGELGLVRQLTTPSEELKWK